MKNEITLTTEDIAIAMAASAAKQVAPNDNELFNKIILETWPQFMEAANMIITKKMNSGKSLEELLYEGIFE